MLKISCILTSYNRPNGVKEAIFSVQKQTYPHWELIIVDDHSNEQTRQLLRQIANHDPRITLIQSSVTDKDRYKTARYATCINLAIPHITGDLVTYLTDDDLYYPTRFQSMVKVFKRNPRIHVVYGRQRVFKYNKRGQVIKTFVRPLVGVTKHPMGKVDHNSFMHRASCFKKVKNWDDHPSLWPNADAGFFRKLVKYWSFHPVNVITDEHRIHPKGVQAKMASGKKPWVEKDTE
ncbi:glycosyltransferase family A protein [Halalkalibacterium halodurans]|uniref:glycosyltransferase family 2 protein n=1 Tax=Halalkalibacterium halodurans TaxID=86665 RepID=UPI002E2117B5|nr:glycosyltransferase family A protein [Halalkalibacterium halodurans]